MTKTKTFSMASMTKKNLLTLHMVRSPDHVVQPDPLLPVQSEALEVLPLRRRHLTANTTIFAILKSPHNRL